MAGKEAPSEQPPVLRAAQALLNGEPNPADYVNLPRPVYVSKFSWSVCPLRPNFGNATVPSMTSPAWPHPLRNTDHDTAQAVADALAWYGCWLWE